MAALEEVLALCQESIRAFGGQQNVSANDYNKQGRVLLDIARTTLAAAVDTFKVGLRCHPGDDALQKGLDEALLKGHGSKIDAIMTKMDSGISRCMQLVREIRSSAEIKPAIGAVAIAPLNVLLVSANTGSCFEGGDLEQDFLGVLHNQLNSSTADVVVLHFQEMCGKEWKTRDVKATCEDFSSKLRAGLPGFWTPGTMFYPPTGPKDNSFTALATILFVRRNLVPTDRLGLFNFKSGREVPLSAFEDEIDLSPFIHHEAFPNADYPEIKAGRKGYLHIRALIDGVPLEFINLHLFHDATNVLAYTEGFPSTFAKARKRALAYVMKQISVTPDSNLFIYGDFNFRLDMQAVVHELLGQDAVATPQEGDKILLSSSSGSHTIHLGPKNFKCSEAAEFVHNWTKFRSYDVEAARNFAELGLVEQAIDFPPSYPFEEEPNKPHEYMSSRCPGWCDRIVYSPHAAKWVDSPKYSMVGYNDSVGDHKPIALKFIWREQ